MHHHPIERCHDDRTARTAVAQIQVQADNDSSAHLLGCVMAPAGAASSTPARRATAGGTTPVHAVQSSRLALQDVLISLSLYYEY